MGKKVKEKKQSIGGQALMEGVMMRGARSMALAVRNPQGEILVESQRIKPKPKVAKLPVVRGVVSFASSLVVGMGTLMRSAEIAAGEEDDQKIGKGWMALSVILGIGLALGIFFFIPGLVSGWINELALKKINNEGARVLLKNLISGVFRVALFIGYLLLVSLLKDIRRNFMYHGAEHKTINCFEKGLPLTVENVQSCSMRHNRCGTTFMFLVMIVSIIVFALVEWALSSFIHIQSWARNFTFMGIKLLCLPLVAGISYEVLFAFAKLPDNLFSKIVRAPGLGLQRLTTKPPDDGMVEVAVCAFNTCLSMESDPAVKPVKFGEIHLSAAKAELIKILTEMGAEPAEADWMLCFVLNCKRSELSGFLRLNAKQYKQLKELIEKRRTQPLDYCLGLSGFYGRNIIVDDRVLIPRPETEILAEQAVAFIKELEETQAKRVDALDLCTGSGCIALTLCKETNAAVVAADISADALQVAAQNLKGTDAQIVQSDLFSNLWDRSFDIIVSNPPYIASGDIETLAPEVKCQPHTALNGGEDGMDFYRKIIPSCKKLLNTGGKVMLEVGYGQAAAVSKLLVSIGGFNSSRIVKDMEGIDRVVIGE